MNETAGEESFLTECSLVWEHTLSENPDGLPDKNWVTDQLMANNGSINYCVRWNTALTSSATNRTKTEAALQRSLNSWAETLVGFEGFPLTKANVKVVGYAVKDKSLLEGDTSSLDVYTTADADGVPECDTRCYRGAHLDDPQGLASCPGGEATDVKIMASVTPFVTLSEHFEKLFPRRHFPISEVRLQLQTHIPIRQRKLIDVRHWLLPHPAQKFEYIAFHFCLMIRDRSASAKQFALPNHDFKALLS
jgi:hypothetical protein